MGTQTKPKYPAWAKEVVITKKAGKFKEIAINTDAAWAEWFERLEDAECKPDVDQYWWDVVRRLITKQIRLIHGPGLIIHFHKCQNEANDPKKMKPGRGYEAGSDEWRRWWEAVEKWEQEDA